MKQIKLKPNFLWIDLKYMGTYKSKYRLNKRGLKKYNKKYKKRNNLTISFKDKFVSLAKKTLESLSKIF